MNPKSYEHEANTSNEWEVCGKSVDNVRKHTKSKEIHEEVSNPCTICEEAFTITNMKKHMRSVHETPMNIC